MTGPQKFRKKPVEVEAIQWTGKNPAAVRAFTGMHQIGNGGEHFVFTTQAGHGELFVAANGAWLDIEIGEWVLRDARGFYPCKPDIFEQTYEAVPEFAAGGFVPPGVFSGSHAPLSGSGPVISMDQVQQSGAFQAMSALDRRRRASTS